MRGVPGTADSTATGRTLQRVTFAAMELLALLAASVALMIAAVFVVVGAIAALSA
jgi:hypothetical protein